MKIVYLFSFLALTLHVQSQISYFYPSSADFDPTIPTPEKFLGYPIGSHHTRHDKIIEYIKELDRLSEKISTQIIGETYEHRPQIVATITSVTNSSRLEQIRQANLKRANNPGGDDEPLVITLGYNVHGNEPSSSEAAMLTAYYLVANQSPETKSWLDGLVILLDPNYNPDGRDRHSHWANMHKGTPNVSDPLDREHTEVWPGGRTNHYWFDLNRDWFLGIHPESRNRMRLFHEWMPYVMTDHHEMGTNSTFYFDPGKYSSNNPVVPSYLYDVVYPKFGEYFTKATESIQSLFYTKESFDKLYPGYGSSYVNFYGGAGFLFEQASSRGHIQETPTVPLTFGFTIRNQATASLATIRASLNEKAMLLKCRRDFYNTASNQAKANPVKAYVFGDKYDITRNVAFVNLLLSHKIEVYETDKDQNINNSSFSKGTSYIVPTDQMNYIMVKSVFEKDITYTDSLFYDASTWSLPHAFGIPFQEVKTAFTKGSKISKPVEIQSPGLTENKYGYLIDFRDYNAYRTLYALQKNNVTILTAFKSFTTRINGQAMVFNHGTLFIPVQSQTKTPAELTEILKSVQADTKVKIYGVETGYSMSGIDLGSNFMRAVKMPKALMLIGFGTNSYEAGEVWHLLDQRINMPISKVDIANINRVDLNNYTAMVLVHGNYSFDKPFEDRLKAWVNGGGTLICFKGASEWASRIGLTREKFVPADTVSAARANYEDVQSREGAKQLGGSIFEADLDITHPLGFGFQSRKISVYKNNKTILLSSKSPASTVAKYAAKPLIGGYLHPSTEPKIANNAALLCSHEGSGRVILFADNPNFRGIWYGTNRLFLNALFLGPLMTNPVGGGFGGEED